MSIKFKRFWTSFILIFCMIGFFAPATVRADGEDISLETLATIGGGTAAVVGLVVLGYFANAMRWLGVKIAQAKEQENKQKVSGMTIDEWCVKNNYKLAHDITSKNPEDIKAAITQAINAGNTFEAAHHNEQYSIHDFVDTLEREIEEIEAVMSQAESYSFVSGFSERNRFMQLGGAEVDWRQNNWKRVCSASVGTQQSHATSQEILHRQPHSWNDVDYRSMDQHIFGDSAHNVTGYIPKIWSINKITKLAVETWWIYFKKLYRHQALYTIAQGMSGKSNADRKARIKQLRETAEDRKASSAQYVFAGHSQDETRLVPSAAPAPQPQQQPQPAPQQSWTSRIFNKWTMGFAGLSALAGAGYWFSK